jgi:hypothetical protein
MTIKVSDLESQKSLLTELSENDISKICGGAGASDASRASADENLATQKANADTVTNYQDQSTAINTKAQLEMKANQSLQQSVNQIKT